ncbi:hypothetical protein CBER1_06646 [Cercospora berteroae]|uniref:BTB domain-containing protein n=1 Tax=Cercospora berteroae TaxID=357750 RepID=A0A2S6C492_9PEZI|nr:hypothetical protein CBER1_06646 [Cercospora berteroae]
MDAIQKVLQKVHISGAHGDFVLAAGDREWKVHKLVLMMHSEVLYKMSTNEHVVESKTGRADLKDVEAEQVNALVHFMYHGDYLNPDGSRAVLWPNSIGPGEVDFHISMVALSDKYIVSALHQFALSCLDTAITEDNVLKMAKQLYDNDHMTEDIRKKIVHVISTNLNSLRDSNDFGPLLDEMPHLAVDVRKFHVQRECEECKLRDDHYVPWSWGEQGGQAKGYVEDSCRASHRAQSLA